MTHGHKHSWWVGALLFAACGGTAAQPSLSGTEGTGTGSSASSGQADSTGPQPTSGPDGGETTSVDTSESGQEESGPTGTLPPRSGLFRDNQLEHGGLVRSYDYYVPVDPGVEPLPLVILLHGHGGSAEGLLGEDGKPAPYRLWMELADEHKLMLLVPDGSLSPDEQTGWNDCRGDAQSNPAVDDVGFIGALLDQMEEALPVDPARVYATGTSNGGHMTIRLALELSGRIAAVAPVVAAMPASSKCTPPARAMPIAFVAGTADPISPWDGGTVGRPKDQRGSVLSMVDSVALWAGHNDATDSVDPQPFPDEDPEDESSIELSQWNGGTAGADAWLFAVLGGGHTEPSLVEHYGALFVLIVGPQNRDAEMAEEVWSFFADKQLSQQR